MGTRKFPPLPANTKRLTHYAPTIIREYFDEDGMRMYETSDNKIWKADAFDFNFVPTKMEVLPRFAPLGTEKSFRAQQKPLNPGR